MPHNTKGPSGRHKGEWICGPQPLGKNIRCWTAAAEKSWSNGGRIPWFVRTPRPSGTPPRRHPGWKTYHARYARSNTGGGGGVKKDLPQRWQVHYRNLTFNIKPMNFKHMGLFPEQAANWDFAMEQIRTAGRPISVLNLFAYTGAASVACAAAGASVCHVDAPRAW